MKISLLHFISISIPILYFAFAWDKSSAHNHKAFRHCLTTHTSNFHDDSDNIYKLIYAPNNSSFLPIWESSNNNGIFDIPTTPKPYLIVTPTDESHIQTFIHCAKRHDTRFRIRGGGHDFEGVSYTADVPFVMLDLANMRSISIDVASKTAWVQGGATFGELYYKISEESSTLGFPGGTWSSVGVSGLISGGGYGTLTRKYGLAGDHVIDVRMIDVNGSVLDRKSMGEDFFWANRGGGASSFGVIVALKLTLVDVPEVVTMIYNTTTRTVEQNATSLFHKWQSFAPNADRDLWMRTRLGTVKSGAAGSGKKIVVVSFEAVFLGGIDRLMKLMQDGFPELGLAREHCTEMSWIQSVLVISGFSSQAPPETLLNRTATVKFAIKAKSDFVQKPISIEGIEGLWEMLLKTDVGVPSYLLSPFGGRMNDISASALPFPHRAGNLFVILERASLDIVRPMVNRQRINWLRSVYSYLTPYVSSSPRSSYVNYIDLDLGVSARSYEEASIWGMKYFGGNFEKLVRVKSKVDPENFFNHPQSIPPFPSSFEDI